jgi:hypothetical protein
LIILIILGSILFWFKGFSALKRMLLIKTHQHFLGTQAGFITALLLDMLVGSFHNYPLSFCFSFLFLGIIYSEKQRFILVILFFLAQMLITYFYQNQISFLMLFLSPLLNFAFALALPFIFILSYPLWNWQLHVGLGLMKGLQGLIDFSAALVGQFPLISIHVGILVCLIFLTLNQKRAFSISLIALSSPLNIEKSKFPSLSRYEFVPVGKLLVVTQQGKIKFEDGSCERQLIQGLWWQKCSPKRKSTRYKMN